MLSSLVDASSASEEPDVEDIFSSSLGSIFTDDAQNAHGSPGTTVVYRSRIYGDVDLILADPDEEESRRLFAHYVWNSSLLVAEAIAEFPRRGLSEQFGEDDLWRRGFMEGRLGQMDWSVKGESVVELGAGTGLAGIISAAAGASRVVITDYPEEQILAPIRKNVEMSTKALSKPCANSAASAQSPDVAVQGHAWGDLDSAFAVSEGHAFSRVIAADTLWMAREHENLVASMQHLLSFDPDARVWVVAGLHTGREKVDAFLDEVGRQGELIVRDKFEVSIELEQREWVGRARPGEGIGDRKRWMAVLILSRP